LWLTVLLLLDRLSDMEWMLLLQLGNQRRRTFCSSSSTIFDFRRDAGGFRWSISKASEDSQVMVFLFSVPAQELELERAFPRV